jgi:hypothetical protein
VRNAAGEEHLMVRLPDKFCVDELELGDDGAPSERSRIV